jgi:predicted RecB family nuclease
MQRHGDSFTLSATDLSNFLGCHHRTALDMEAAAGARIRPHFYDPLLELLYARGLEHEKAYVTSLIASGRDVTDLSHLIHRPSAVTATTSAMHDGADVIVQGALQHQQWYGRPDIMLRVPLPSRFGPWSYEVSDTKLARDTRAGAILQLGLYSEMLSVAQGRSPEYFRVVTPDPHHPEHAFRVDDYAAYFRLVLDQLASTVMRPADDVAAEHYPEPVEHCDICAWLTYCVGKRRADDHLSLVAGITRVQRRELEGRGTGTLSDLGRLALPLEFKPDRGSSDSYVRVREQARLQLDSRGRIPPLHELRDIVDKEGLCRMPEPSPGDIFLDLEGDNLVIEGGREYLFGIAYVGANGETRYESHWAFTEADERIGFERVMDFIAERIAVYPDMHVYHYAPYESTAFKRLMGRYATRERELDAMLRGGRFIDLYAVVRQGVRAGIERYSIKNLEPLYDFVRAVPLAEANRGLRALELALGAGAWDLLPHEVRATVEGYNRDDCVSTLWLRDWLELVRVSAIASGAVIDRPKPQDSEPSPELHDRQRETEALRQRLLESIEGTPHAGTPEHARWLMAYLLDFHPREDKASWWKYFELCDCPDDELMDESAAVAGLTLESRVGITRNRKTNKPTGSVVDRYSYPPQEMEIRRDGKLWVRGGVSFGEVAAVDRIACTIDVKKGRAQAEEHPSAMFEHTHIGTGVLEDAIAAVGEAVASASGCDGANGIARALLLREPPRLSSAVFAQPDDVPAGDFAIGIAGKLHQTVLAIQGPPGSGKTSLGARMICALVAQGKKVGVMANSHTVIENLLCEVTRAAEKANVAVRVAQKTSAEEDAMPCGIMSIANNDEALRMLATNEAAVVGGTAWLWARSDMAASVDVLFVDEAGQVSLANAIAASRAANSMVLLGDPQQLDQPQKGSHPEGVELSALQHLLGAHLTLQPDMGVFLPTTWRLSPAICNFTSELFYEGRLAPQPSSINQVLSGIGELSGSGLFYVDVKHDGRTSSSDEEVEIVVELVSRLTAEGAMWTASDGVTTQLTLGDVLVVSPFNAQVSRLCERLPGGARVGTVDKFQGQAAPVVIYSMATSRPEDAPRGMEFLYSLNRLNVATSRAKCAVIIVANPRLFAPECRSPRQMKLANALCRYREMGRRVEGMGSYPIAVCSEEQ